MIGENPIGVEALDSEGDVLRLTVFATGSLSGTVTQTVGTAAVLVIVTGYTLSVGASGELTPENTYTITTAATANLKRSDTTANVNAAGVARGTLTKTVVATGLVRLVVTLTAAATAVRRKAGIRLNTTSTARLTGSAVSRTKATTVAARLMKATTLTVGSTGRIGPTVTSVTLSTAGTAVLNGDNRTLALGSTAVLYRAASNSSIRANRLFWARRDIVRANR